MSLDPKTIEQNKRLADRMALVKNKIVIMSGKGGVGKTTVSINLAYGLAIKGYKVGLLDTDLHGPNIAKMLGVEDRTLRGSDEAIHPVEVIPGLKAISLAFSGNDKDVPYIWRGPMKTGVIRQFIADVEWGELDYLIVDTPPGTGDESLTVCQTIPELTGAVIVTTPQSVSVLDSRKSINFAKKLDVRVLGVVENMSGFICPHCGERVDIFKSGGGKKAAEELSVPFLGSIPLDPRVTEAGDSGKPSVEGSMETPANLAVMELVTKIEQLKGE